MSILRQLRRKNAKKDPAYKAWIASLPCVVCVGFESFLRMASGTHTWGDFTINQHTPADVAHIGERGLGQKCPDRETAPLCWKHHARESKESVHSIGKTFWQQHGLDPKLIISELNARYNREAK